MAMFGIYVRFLGGNKHGDPKSPFSTWRIIPFNKCLIIITIVSKSPK